MRKEGRTEVLQFKHWIGVPSGLATGTVRSRSFFGTGGFLLLEEGCCAGRMVGIGAIDFIPVRFGVLADDRGAAGCRTVGGPGGTWLLAGEGVSAPVEDPLLEGFADICSDRIGPTLTWAGSTLGAWG